MLVRQESWGLLFYAQTRQRMFFVRSGTLISPHQLQSLFSPADLVQAICRRTALPSPKVEARLEKVLDNLLKNGIVVHELL